VTSSRAARGCLLDLEPEAMPETQAQYSARILRHVAGREPLPLLTAAPDTLAALLAAVPPALCARRPAPGKWSIQEVVAHLADDELVGAYRIRLILAAPGTAIQAFDQDRWAETGRYADTDPWRALALFRTLREANLALWHRLSPDEWERAGVHAERGVESIRDIATYYAGHDLNHFAQIGAILASAGPRPGTGGPGR
jgi:DinB superfamily